jgi:intracellular septation protein
MKLLFDFFPILLFFIAYKTNGIFVATTVAIGATILQVAFSWIKHRQVETMHWITLVLIIVFGGATLLLQDEMFIKWKPTVINWLFGLAFLGSQVIGKRPLVERMISNALTLPEMIWRRLNMMWAFYFLSLGCINLYVVYNFDTETWVNFKLFGMLGLTLAFVVLQTIYLSRYIVETETETEK